MADLPRQSDALELVRSLDAGRPGQVRELYRRGHRYFAVSTVPELRHGDGGWQDDLIDLTAAVAPAFGHEYADQGEETMAFEANASGEITDWTEVAVATGPDSREQVLGKLRDA